MTHQYKPGDRVRNKTGGELGRVQEVREDGIVVVQWEMESDPWILCYTPHRIDEYIEPIPAEPAPAAPPLTDAQVAQVVDAVLAKLAVRQPLPSEPAVPEGDPSRIQVGDTVWWKGLPATVLATHGSEACILMGVAGLYVASIHYLTKVTTNG